nr:hypothetical protein Iba_scaffold970CG0330 [Ipomoea batatas]
MVVCWSCGPLHSRMSTQVKVIVFRMTNFTINNCPWLNIIRRPRLEELGVMILLSNNDCELG